MYLTSERNWVSPSPPPSWRQSWSFENSVEALQGSCHAHLPGGRWVEQGTAPDRTSASGTNFTLGTGDAQPAALPYRQEARYVGPADGDHADASNYGCVAPQ
jgi:hypothetical protein